MKSIKELLDAAYSTLLTGDDYNALVCAVEQAIFYRDNATTDALFMAADSEYALLSSALKHQDALYKALLRVPSIAQLTELYELVHDPELLYQVIFELLNEQLEEIKNI